MTHVFYAAVVAKLQAVSDALDAASREAASAKDSDLHARMFKIKEQVWDLFRLAFQRGLRGSDAKERG